MVTIQVLHSLANTNIQVPVSILAFLEVNHHDMRFIVFLLGCTFLSCSLLGDDKLIRREVNHKSINVKWYYESLITSNTADKIEVQYDGVTHEIIRAKYAILDFTIEDEVIRIKMIANPNKRIYEIYPDQYVFGYRIIIDSAGKEEELSSIPKGR